MPWYRVCTKEISISQRSYGVGEPKTVNLESVKTTYTPVRVCKLSAFMQRGIGPIIKICVHVGYMCVRCECTCMCMLDEGGVGACSSRKSLEIRCSEIVPEAILGQKRSRSSYMACRVLHPIFGCPLMHFLSQLTSNFQEIRY